MYDQNLRNGTIDYPTADAAAGTNGTNAFNFSLVAIGAGQPIKFWAVSPTGYARTDYQLGSNFGKEIVHAAANKPKVIAVMLTKAMMALPDDAGPYEQMLKGLFDCITAELARAAALDDTLKIENVELAPPPS